MNIVTTYFLALVKRINAGTIQDSVDPAPPSDLGDPLTQDDIDFIKTFRKDMTERFPTPTCTAEKSNLQITDYDYSSLTLTWDNPVDYGSSLVQYKVSGDTEWLDVNVEGNATGYYNPERTMFVFTSGLNPILTYEILVRNGCRNGAFSSGVSISSVATCSDEKTDVAIINTEVGSFTISWTNPAGYSGTAITYRLSGDTEWQSPNAVGNATGSFIDTSTFSFDSGFNVGDTYEIKVQNICPSSELSNGVIVTDTVTPGA